MSRDVTIKIRITAAEAKALRAAAKAADLSVSEYGRRRIMGPTIVEVPPPPETPALEPPKRRRAPT